MSQDSRNTPSLLRRLPLRYSLRTLLMLPVVWACGWWWGTWPRRTALEFIELKVARKEDEAERMVRPELERDRRLIRRVWFVREPDSDPFNIQAKSRTLWDIIVGRQVFTMPDGLDIAVERGWVRMPQLEEFIIEDPYIGRRFELLPFEQFEYGESAASEND